MHGTINLKFGDVLVVFTLSLRVAGKKLSFSKLKVIKYCKRNFIRHTRLNNLAVLVCGYKKKQNEG
jgi:hypothetical protein